MKNVVYLFVFLITLIACGGKDEKSEQLLKEAAQIHNEAMAIHDSLMPKIKKINDLKANLILQKDSLVGKNDSLAGELQKQIATIEEIGSDMKLLMENMVEVPGNEAHHHHEHGEGHEHHDHNHSKTEVTSEQMLEIQKEMKANILKIKEKISSLKK